VGVHGSAFNIVLGGKKNERTVERHAIHKTGKEWVRGSLKGERIMGPYTAKKKSNVRRGGEKKEKEKSGLTLSIYIRREK